MSRSLIVVLLFSALAGCVTTPSKKGPAVAESSKDVLNAVGQVADALSGQSLSDEQKKKLIKDIQKDKEAQSALRSIADGMDVKKTVVKYCPVDGKRYSVDQEVCPEHHVRLETLVD